VSVFRRVATFSVFVVLVWTPAIVRGQSSNPEHDATTRANALVAAGRPGEAAALLASLAARYPDDFALCMRTASLYFADHSHERALSFYLHAHELARGESRDAELGRAYSLLALDRASEARTVANSLLERDPDDAEARALLDRSAAERAPQLETWAWFLGGYQHYVGHPYKTHSLAASPGILLSFRRLLTVSATYRLLRYQLAHYDEQFQLQNPEGEVQQELYVAAGVLRERFAARMHYGHIWDVDNTLLPAQVVGASASLWWWLTADAELSLTRFLDSNVLRAAVSVELPLFYGVSAGPLATIQPNDEVLSSFGGRLRWTSDTVGISLDGRVGTEQRPTSLADSLSFATNDRIRGQLSPRVDLSLLPNLTVTASYTYQLLEVTALTGDVQADAHFFNLALVAHPARPVSTSTAR